MIWEPFALALFLGLIVSAGLYFAYLWPSVAPADDEPETPGADARSPEAPPPSPGAPGGEDPGADAVT